MAFRLKQAAIGVGLSLVLIGFSEEALSLPTTYFASGETTRSGILGVQFIFGKQVEPELYAGVIAGQTYGSGNVAGAKVTVNWGFHDGVAPIKVKATGLVGSQDAQAEFGVGYDLKTGVIFGVAGVNGDHIAIGIDFSSKFGLEPYAGYHSFGKFPVKQTLAPTPPG